MTLENKLDKKIVFATNNLGKLKEAREICAPFGIQLLSINDVRAMHRELPEYREPEEGEVSYFENAKIKARACFDWCGMPCVGDDSGLEVEALGWGPGIISARYAGSGATARTNKDKLLLELANSSTRSARMRCVLCFKVSAILERCFEGVLECKIATEERGQGGFGYDPLLIVTGTDRTLAELKDSGFDIATHRALAFRKLAAQVEDLVH